MEKEELAAFQKELGILLTKYDCQLTIKQNVAVLKNSPKVEAVKEIEQTNATNQ